MCTRGPGRDFGSGQHLVQEVEWAGSCLAAECAGLTFVPARPCRCRTWTFWCCFAAARALPPTPPAVAIVHPLCLLREGAQVWVSQLSAAGRCESASCLSLPR